MPVQSIPSVFRAEAFEIESVSETNFIMPALRQA